MAIKNGTAGNDIISGTTVADTIHGNGGNDTIKGLAGNDTLYGDAGNDTLTGGAGKDTLWGGGGADIFKYGGASESKGTAVDLILDFNQADSGGDVLNTSVLGTAVVESKYYAGYAGLQAVFSYNSTTDQTTLSYYKGSATPIFQVKFAGNVSYSDPYSDDYYWGGVTVTPDPNFVGIKFSTTPTVGDDVLANKANIVENVNAGAGNDVILSSEAGDIFHGGAGDDDFYNGSGTLYGDAGNDTFIYPVDALVYGGDGNDYLDLGGEYPIGTVTGFNGGAGYDTAFGFFVDTVDNTNPSAQFTGIEKITGGVVNFVGSAASETVICADWWEHVTFSGNGGNDILWSGEGGSYFVGGAGNDTLDGSWGGLYGNLSNDDTAVFSGNFADYNITVPWVNPYDWGIGSATVTDKVGGRDGVDTLIAVEYLKFADGTYAVADLMGPPPAPTNGPDSLAGTEGNDGAVGASINLLDGNDRYYGLGGDDVVDGGAGDDDIFGGTDYQTDGPTGNDRLSGGIGADNLFGEDGNDTLLGGQGDDTLYGAQGNDLLSGGQGNDYIYGGSEDDGSNGYDVVLANNNGTTKYADYTITVGIEGYSITLADTNTSDATNWGTDTLVGVEAIQFNDGIYDVATNTFTPNDSVI